MEELQPPAHLKSRRQKEIWRKQQLDNLKARKKAHETQTPFRIAERNLQSSLPTPDQPPIVDFVNLDNNTRENRDKIQEVELHYDLHRLCPLFGESDQECPARKQKAYIHTDIDGLIFIPNPFTAAAQRKLVYNCLHNYTQSPNLSNLDAHYDIPTPGVWNLHVTNQKSNNEDSNVDSICRKESPKRQKTDNGYQNSDLVNATDQKSRPDNQNESRKSSNSALKPSELVKKLRWVTLGYQYNWTTKVYDFDNPVEFPSEAGNLSVAVAKAAEGLGYKVNDEYRWQNTYRGEDFIPEAGIVNYYQLKDTLMAHVDRSELNMEAPLISISLGHDCIYLIGGPTRNTTPTAIRLRSGDVMVMTGNARSAYHGVPKILPSAPTFLQPDIKDAQVDDWELYGEFISKARINLNIRQVNKCE
ncbi:hypothetical protein INT43_000585 [Umbelopsis isabellina]|uniref:Fe2OG dioxygenase domain-containing protein n=1 Tax=Mortierella isabellina TaxID=91625 RepID=A0A8H7UK37_MORIS|nr:hypothetical protein INT43_000585 [Umbelopsis isabellina]